MKKMLIIALIGLSFNAQAEVFAQYTGNGIKIELANTPWLDEVKSNQYCMNRAMAKIIDLKTKKFFFGCWEGFNNFTSVRITNMVNGTTLDMSTLSFKEVK